MFHGPVNKKIKKTLFEVIGLWSFFLNSVKLNIGLCATDFSYLIINIFPTFLTVFFPCHLNFIFLCLGMQLWWGKSRKKLQRNKLVKEVQRNNPSNFVFWIFQLKRTFGTSTFFICNLVKHICWVLWLGYHLHIITACTRDLSLFVITFYLLFVLGNHFS